MFLVFLKLRWFLVCSLLYFSTAFYLFSKVFLWHPFSTICYVIFVSELRLSVQWYSKLRSVFKSEFIQYVLYIATGVSNWCWVC